MEHVFRKNTTVYHKYTHKDLYLYWDALLPINYKGVTLRTLVNKAYLHCFKKRNKLKISIFKQKWLLLLDNYAVNEKNKRKSKTKGSHSNWYERAGII